MIPSAPRAGVSRSPDSTLNETPSTGGSQKVSGVSVLTRLAGASALLVVGIAGIFSLLGGAVRGAEHAADEVRRVDRVLASAAE